MTGPWRLGLTGSIGMGKSTTAAMFAEEGIPVWDADAVVHRLYTEDGAGVAPIAQLAPEAVSKGSVDRESLRRAIEADPSLLPRIEAAIHPLVAADRVDFLDAHRGAAIVLFDIPLLFETGAENWLDSIIVVSAPKDIQRARVLSRAGVTRDDFDRILSRQMADAAKRTRADHIIETGSGLDAARRSVRELLSSIRQHPGEDTNA